MFLGSREDIGHIGYARGRCPKCGFTGMLSVLRAKRKLTVAVLVQFPVNEQLVVECPSCTTRFGVPAEQLNQVMAQIISPEQLSGMADRASRGQPTAPTVNGSPSPGRTLYQVMQVDPAADPEVIEAAFKRLAFKYHPDRSTDAEAATRMRELIEARDVLGDSQRRERYDRSIGIVRAPKMPEAMRSDDV